MSTPGKPENEASVLDSLLEANQDAILLQEMFERGTPEDIHLILATQPSPPRHPSPQSQSIPPSSTDQPDEVVHLLDMPNTDEAGPSNANAPESEFGPIEAEL
ncbi:hypothetical protein L6452_37237 [Arctium lappa]|uniref:Uncharacterized protein n=1 Tax=Arctium lappa TaxID=4217 RepID=A0ACB8Y2X8_ARCLA|nr:hypothetical protein L6452_37237 [Arctium lappa]